MAVRTMRVCLFFFLLLGGFVCAFLRERGFPFGRGGLRRAVMVGWVLGKRGFGFCAVSDGKIRRQFPAGGLVWNFILFDYFPFCSSWSVTVVWSHTSDGPKYWIGPGYM